MSTVTPVIKTPLGQFVMSSSDHWIGSALQINGSHQGNDLDLILSFLKPGDRVLDLGAHVGTIAVPMATKVGDQGFVRCVEASDRTADLLRENIRLNGLRNIEVVCAVVATDGAAYRPSEDVGEMRHTGALKWVRTSQDEGDGEDALQSVTVDSLLAGMDYRVDYIKCDIEGHDVSIVKSLDFSKFAKAPVISFESTSFRRSQPAIDHLSRHGYRLLANIGPRNAGVVGMVPIEIHQIPRDSKLGLFDLFAFPPGELADSILGRANDWTRQMTLLFRNRRYREACELFRTLADPSTEQLAIYAESCRLARDSEQACASYRKLLQRRPSAFVHDALARELCALDRFDEARQAVDAAIAADPDRLGFQVTLARILMASDQQDAAEQQLGAVVEKVPEYSRAVVALAQLKLQKGDLAAAEALAQRLVSFDQENPLAYLLLGKVQSKKKDPAGAARSFERCLELDPGNAAAKQLLQVVLKRPAAARSAS